MAHEGDTIDCVKRLICELQKSNDANLDWDEKIIKNFVKRQIDFSVPHAQFHFAADIGRKQNINQCGTVFSRYEFIAWKFSSFFFCLSAQILREIYFWTFLYCFSGCSFSFSKNLIGRKKKKRFLRCDRLPLLHMYYTFSWNVFTEN